MRVRPAAGKGEASIVTALTIRMGTTPGLPSIVGFGANALSTLGAGSYVVSSTASGTGAGTWGGAWAWLAADNEGTVTFSVGGTFPVPNQVNEITGKSNFLIDGRSAPSPGVTLSGGCLKFNTCDHFAVVNVRHQGGWSGSQDADCFTQVTCSDFAFANVSTRGHYDEGLSSTINCVNYTLQDCLFGIGEGGAAGDAWDSVAHNYASLNYGGTANMNGPGSFIRCTFVDKDYRNPKVGYHNDEGVGFNTLTSEPITGDIVNNVTINCNYAITADYGAKVNNINQYDYNSVSGNEAINGAVIGTSYTVPGWAQVTPMTATDAKNYAKTNAGCLPHDTFDTTILAEIP